MTSVGIVGGLGVGATVHYYEKITASCKARGVVPDLVIVHADVDYGQDLIRAGKLDELADYLASFIERLGEAGAQAAVLPAVTPHIAIAQLKQRTKVPILNIVDPIEVELKARKIGRVALYGTIFTMQGSLWGQLTGVEIVKPQPQEMEFIGKAYRRILDSQEANPVDAGELRRIAAELQRRDGVQAILLAGTDLALMFDEESAGFPAIDVARLHIGAIVERLAG
jgi:aspartate racemase